MITTKHRAANSEISHLKTQWVDCINHMMRIVPRMEKAFNEYGNLETTLTEEEVTEIMQDTHKLLCDMVVRINEHKERYDRNSNPIGI